MTPQEKQIIKARFFGTHIECKVSYEAQNGTKVIGTLHGVHHIDNDGVVCFCSCKEFGHETIPMRHCKLILRPLDSITHEEIEQLLHILGWLGSNSKAVYWLNSGVFDFVMLGRILRHGGYERVFSGTDYLCSIGIGICLPFMGLDPVKEGWAVIEG